MLAHRCEERALSDAATAIAWKADEIEIPYPERDLHLRSAADLPLGREGEF